MSLIPPEPPARLDYLLARCLPAMTLIDVRDGRELYYYEPPWAVSPLWVARLGDTVALCYAGPHDSREAMEEIADGWIAALQASTVPETPPAPLYAVHRRADGSILESRSTFGADWCGLFYIPLPARTELVPRGWRDDERVRIVELARHRRDGPL